MKTAVLQRTLRYLSPAAVVLLTAISCNRDNPVGPDDHFAATGSRQKVQAVTDTIRGRVEAMRGLTFHRDVYAAILTREDYRESFFETDWDSDTERKEASDFVTRMMRQVGYIRRSDSVETIFEQQEEMYGEFADAFYRRGRDSLYVIIGDDLSEKVVDSVLASPGFRPLIAHELIHALQDQALEDDLRSFEDLEVPFYSSDYYLSRLSLIEGDARYFQLRYWYEYVFGDTNYVQLTRDWVEDRFTAFFLDIHDHSLMPPEYLSVVMWGPYEIGPNWVSQYSDNWAALDARFGDPPLSTTEVVTREDVEPVQFDFEPLYELFDFTNGDVMVDILGGLLVSVLVHGLDPEGVGSLDALKATYGWRGDRLLYEDAGEGSTGKFIWAFSFDDTQHSMRVWNALRHFHDQSDPDYYRPHFDSSSTDSTGTYSRVSRFFAGSHRSCLALEDTCVYWIDNLGVDSDEALSLLLAGTALAKSRADGDPGLRNQLFKFLPKRHRHRQERSPQ